MALSASPRRIVSEFRIAMSALAVCFVFSFAGAHAQTLAPRVSTIAGQPSATVSFKPVETRAELNGSIFQVIIGPVNIYDNTGAVDMQTAWNSSVYFTEGFPITNGFYSVQFHFTWTAGMVARITRGTDTLAECSLPKNTSFTIEQTCDSGVFEVTDGKFPVSVKSVGGGGAHLARITLNSYPPPTTLKIRD